MCGIAGLVRTDGSAADVGVVEAMVKSIDHRGPDAQGTGAFGPMAYGMRRLAIRDLSPTGNQPLANEDGQVEVVYNGELYNAGELRQRLEAQGHVFRGTSDTEVLVHGYEALGIEALCRQLEGMFAFALLDKRAHQLHLARDAFGIKPLYLREGPGQLSFASEVRALACDGRGPPAIDPGFLGGFLRLGFVSSPRSAFQGVRRLEPGTLLTIDLKTFATRSARFFLLLPERTWGDPLAALEGQLELAVKRELVADVPVGVFLSGGLDSSTLLAVASGQGAVPRSFSMGFAGSDRGDEGAQAAAIARHLGSPHTVIDLEPASLNQLPEIVEHLEEPLADSAVLPLWTLCQGTARHVKVALSGEGGDEAFGGYARYFWSPVIAAAARLPSAPFSLLGQLASRLPPRSRGPLNVLRRAGKFAQAAGLDEAERYLSLFDVFTAGERHALAGTQPDRAAERVQGLFAEAHALGLDALQRMQYADLRSFLVDNLLAKSDKLAMAHSLEVRVPLLEKPLVALGLGLPAQDKIDPRGGKRLLRRFVAKRLPREVARRPKRGFETPIDAWFRTEAARGHRERLSSGALVKKLDLSPAPIAEWVRRHAAGEDLGRKLFALASLEAWAERYA